MDGVDGGPVVRVEQVSAHVVKQKPTHLADQYLWNEAEHQFSQLRNDRSGAANRIGSGMVT